MPILPYKNPIKRILHSIKVSKKLVIGTTGTKDFRGTFMSGGSTGSIPPTDYYTKTELNATDANAGSTLIGTNTTNFDNNLSGVDDTVQKALDTLDDLAVLTNPMTTVGDIIVGGVDGAAERYGIGSSGDFLGISGGTPTWEDPKDRFYTETESDARFLKLDCSNDPLTGTLEVEPSITAGTGNQIIDIQNQTALVAEAHLTHLRILGDALDPSGADTRIRGIAVNLSGVDTSNVPESLEGIRIVMPSGLTGPARANTDAIHITEGDIHHDFSVTNTAGELFTAYDAIADVSLQHANSHVHFFDVSTANGEPSGKVVGLGVHSYVAPIHQHIGTYTSPSQTEYAGRKTNGGSNWADGIDGIECFVQKNDEVYIGSTSQFSEIEVVIGTPGTKPVTPTFWYNTAADTWTQFYPEDATDGFQQSGLIHWPLEDISALWTNNGDPGGAETSAGYWIKIIRTANPDPGSPTPTTMKTGVVTLYEWDKDGDITAHEFTGANVTSGADPGHTHSIYALLDGRPGGQTLYGGTDASDDLTLESTSHGTRGDVNINNNIRVHGNGDVDLGGSLSGSDPMMLLDYTNELIELRDSGGLDYAIFRLGTSGTTTFNAQGRDIDFRISGTSETDLFFVDASTGRIGVGTDTPNEKLHVADKIRADTCFNLNGTDGITRQAVTAIVIRDSLGTTHTLTFLGGILTGYVAI